VDVARLITSGLSNVGEVMSESRAIVPDVTGRVRVPVFIIVEILGDAENVFTPDMV
jgi:hypothetical protein